MKTFICLLLLGASCSKVGLLAPEDIGVTEGLGLCVMPPKVHEGAERVACATVGDTQAWCHYKDAKCTYTMATKTCTTWEFLGKECSE